MKKLVVLMVIMFAFCGSLSYAQQVLQPRDHTKVMMFTLHHQREIAQWLQARHSKTPPSPDEFLNFLYQLSNNRSTYNIHLILRKTLGISSKIRSGERSRSQLTPGTEKLIKQVKDTHSILQLESLLKKKNRGMMQENSPAGVGIQVANEILQDGISSGLYSESTFEKFAPHMKGQTRGFWHSTSNYVSDLAKKDTLGALVGAVFGPDGAIANAIRLSAGTVAKDALKWILSNPHPAY